MKVCERIMGNSFANDQKYYKWINNAPMEATHMLVLKDHSGLPFPWYVLEGQDVRCELKHFGRRRILFIFDMKNENMGVST